MVDDRWLAVSGGMVVRGWLVAGYFVWWFACSGLARTTCWEVGGFEVVIKSQGDAGPRAPERAQAIQPQLFMYAYIIYRGFMPMLSGAPGLYARRPRTTCLWVPEHQGG